MRYGSDMVVDTLRELGIRDVAFNPGASIRGLQDSLSRAEGVRSVLALHEEVAVGIAHGYAKASGRPMAVFLHDLVGIQHAQLAIFNAFMDCVPMVLIGGSGPRDWSARRPWIDWVHSAQPQSAFLRDIVKWDEEPASMESVVPVLNRAWRMAMSAPTGPVYVSLDTLIQEAEVDESLHQAVSTDVPPPLVVEPAVIADLAHRLSAASYPVFVVDRPGPGTMAPLVQVAEHLGAAVVDLGSRCSFPTNHPLNLSGGRNKVLGQADVVVLIEPRDAVWAVSSIRQGSRTVESLVEPGTDIIAVGMTERLHSGLIDRQAPPSGVRYLDSDPATFLGELSRHLTGQPVGPAERIDANHSLHRQLREAAVADATAHATDSPVHPGFLALTLGRVLDGVGDWTLANGLLGGWPMRLWDFEREDSYLGRSGGEGLGYGLPASVGAALAHKDTGRLVVNIQSDGDFMYAPQALWTAANMRLPLLVVVHDNGGYDRDRAHQREIAHLRERPYFGKTVGVDIGDPAIDFVGLAAAQGVEPIATTSDPAELESVLTRACRLVLDESRPAIVSVTCSS
jgi:thiamine pyrophosphate-dependent acetolactate synthase large subunit-like protein